MPRVPISAVPSRTVGMSRADVPAMTLNESIVRAVFLLCQVLKKSNHFTLGSMMLGWFGVHWT